MINDINVVKNGDIVEGEVISVEDRVLYIDLKAQTDGELSIENYGDPGLQSFVGQIKVGDVIKAKAVRVSNDNEAMIILSRREMVRHKKTTEIEEAVQKEEIVKIKITKVEEKGLIFRFKGQEGFLPYSLLDYELIDIKDQLVGKTLEVQLIEFSKRGRFTKLIASRKKIGEEQRREEYEERLRLRHEEIETINTGDILKGTVAKIDKHAASIKFNHAYGMLRISQVSHHRIEKLSDVLELGQEVEVRVIKKENTLLDLSMKALKDTPFQAWINEHNVGDKVSGTIFQKLPFGLIIELEKGVRGLLHRSEFSWNPNDNFDSHVKFGDEIEVAIIALDADRERISLSKKQLEDNPWKNVDVKLDEIVDAKVTEIDEREMKVEVQGIEGIIPIGEVSKERISRIEDYYSVGDEVKAVVTEVNPRRWSLKLSIRQVLEKQERESFEKYLTEDQDEAPVTIGDFLEEEK